METIGAADVGAVQMLYLLVPIWTEVRPLQTQEIGGTMTGYSLSFFVCGKYDMEWWDTLGNYILDSRNGLG